jgi:chemotaxis protein methyltransferase CheR
MQTDAVPDALWKRLSEYIAENTGLNFPPERRSDLERGLTAAAAEFGFADNLHCADWLLSTPLSRPQLHALASHLTIGETYFFRERGTFDALAQKILPELLSRRRVREKRIRLWSAACSTGEEPYSLAILMQRLLPDWKDWHVTILATDINPRSLQKASAGVYGEWSFRQSPSWFKDRYFTRTADGRFAVEPRIRDCVNFAPLNLAGDSFPSLATDTNAMDVIFCRNVLMYFTPAQQCNVVENLRGALTEGGWLAVSPTECSQELFRQFVAVNFPDTVIYRKRGTGKPGSVFIPTAPDPILKRAAYVASVPDLAAPPAEPVQIPAAPGPTAQGPEVFSKLARELANEGKLIDSLTWTERWINADKLDAAAHYFHAMVLQETGAREAARRSLERAVYLQPEFVLAHFALANLARAEARGPAANKHFVNALALLRGCPPDQLLPESEGTTAGRLTQIITTLLALQHRSAEGVRR